jgi:DNA-directed RNA polymerase specialized sigma24 family protein
MKALGECALGVEESTVATIAVPPNFLPTAEGSCSEQQPGFVSRAREGHEEAFFGLFELHRKRVYSLCLRLIGSIPEAEELTRDIFMEAFCKLNAIADDAAFSKWLYHNAVHAVLMRLRQCSAWESSCASHRDEELWSNSWEVSGLWEHLEGQGG